ncbi:MAG: hypothetical protein WA869_36580, partial [Alloacidobacterium sp.]
AAPAAPAAPAVELASDKPTLLEQFGKDPAKPVDGAANPADPAVAAPPVYTSFELPEGLSLDAEKMTAYTGVLGKYNLPQEAGQELMNMHAEAMQTYADHMMREQHRIFAETRENWTRQVMADPELGGAGHQTAMGAIARMRDLLVSEPDRPAFEEFLRVTGAGDHPAFLKVLHKVARYFDEPAMPPPNAKPTKTNGMAPNKRGLYGNSPPTLNR